MAPDLRVTDEAVTHSYDRWNRMNYLGGQPTRDKGASGAMTHSHVANRCDASLGTPTLPGARVAAAGSEILIAEVHLLNDCTSKKLENGGIYLFEQVDDYKFIRL